MLEATLICLSRINHCWRCSARLSVHAEQMRRKRGGGLRKKKRKKTTERRKGDGGECRKWGEDARKMEGKAGSVERE